MAATARARLAERFGEQALREALVAAYQNHGQPLLGRGPNDGLTAWPTLEAPPLD